MSSSCNLAFDKFRLVKNKLFDAIMNNTNIGLYFSIFVGINVTRSTEHLVIVNIVGNILTMQSDALLLL